MSYVQANTSNPLGRRNLGRLRGLGWDNLPHPVYPLSMSVRQLNGLRGYGLRGDDSNGAVTYRIDPRTGQYQFFSTDIKPRGVFMQNTFQHPAPPVITALGTTLQRVRVSRDPMIGLRPGVQLSGLGCGSCGGRCNSLDGPRYVRRRRGMGDVTDPTAPASSDISIDPNTGCQVDSDGVLLTCPTGPGASQQPTKTLPTMPVNTADPGLFAQLVSATQQVGQGVSTQPRIQQNPSSNPFAGISTTVLATGVVVFAALLSRGGRR